MIDRDRDSQVMIFPPQMIKQNAQGRQLDRIQGHNDLDNQIKRESELMNAFAPLNMQGLKAVTSG